MTIVHMKDVHPWHREWPGLIIQPGDIGRVTEESGGLVLVWWVKQANASWCKLEILEVVG